MSVGRSVSFKKKVCCVIYIKLRLCHKALGIAIAKSGMGFVYGGGKNGIMGTVSGTALEGGAKVTGQWNYKWNVSCFFE